MIGTYKKFFDFVNNISPVICSLWEDFNIRKDPQKGDMFLVKQGDKCIKAVFDRILFDDTFENGVAFFYIFISNDKEIKIHSINDVYNYKKLTQKEKKDIYKFWIDCKPINDK